MAAPFQLHMRVLWLLSGTIYPEMSENHEQGQGSRALTPAFFWTLAGTFLVVTASPSLGCRINLQKGLQDKPTKEFSYPENIHISYAERRCQLYSERRGAGQAESGEQMWHCSSRTQGQGFRSGVEGLCFSTKLL